MKENFKENEIDLHNLVYDGAFVEMTGLIQNRESCFAIAENVHLNTTLSRFLKKRKSEKIANKRLIIGIGIVIICVFLILEFIGVDLRTLFIDLLRDEEFQSSIEEYVTLFIVSILLSVPSIALNKNRQDKLKDKIDNTPIDFWENGYGLSGKKEDQQNLALLVEKVEKTYKDHWQDIGKRYIFPNSWSSISDERRIQILLEAICKDCLIKETGGYKLIMDVSDLEKKYRKMSGLKNESNTEKLPSKWQEYKRFVLKKEALEDALNRQMPVAETEAYRKMIEEEMLKKQYMDIFFNSIHFGYRFPEFWCLIELPERRSDMLREACEKQIPLEKTDLYKEKFDDLTQEVRHLEQVREVEAFDKKEQFIVDWLFLKYSIMLKKEWNIRKKAFYAPVEYDLIEDSKLRIRILEEALIKKLRIHDTQIFCDYLKAKGAESEYKKMIEIKSGITTSEDLFSKEWEINMCYAEKTDCLNQALQDRCEITNIVLYKRLCHESTLLSQYMNTTQKIRDIIGYKEDGSWQEIQGCSLRIEILDEALKKNCIIKETNAYRIYAKLPILDYEIQKPTLIGSVQQFEYDGPFIEMIGLMGIKNTGPYIFIYEKEYFQHENPQLIDEFIKCCQNLRGTEKDQEELEDIYIMTENLYLKEVFKRINGRHNEFPTGWMGWPVEVKIPILMEVFEKICRIVETNGYKRYIEVRGLEGEYYRMVQTKKEKEQKNYKLPKTWSVNRRYILKKQVLEEAIYKDVPIHETQKYKRMAQEEELRKTYLSLYNQEINTGMRFPKYWIIIESEEQRIDILKEACDKRISISETELYKTFEKSIDGTDVKPEKIMSVLS